MIRMVLDADVDPAKLDSLIAIRSGTAPLETDVQDAFERKFGCAILVDYGAAEFIGGLAGWTIKDHRQFSQAKRGSVGRAKGDVAIRVVAPGSFAPLPVDQVGIVEVKSDRYGPDWPTIWPGSMAMASSFCRAGRTMRSTVAASRSCPKTSRPCSAGIPWSRMPRWSA
jgi:acyl-coenzyme A synthetase/AMP-(fatty) acid ligase